MLDLLAHNDWERPIYFVSPSEDANLGLSDYLQLEGFAYRLIPIKTESKDRLNAGRVDTDIMYENLMKDFKWGNINDLDVYVDYTTRRTSRVIRIRNKFARLADKLNKEGKRDKAIKVLDRGMELTPNEQIPYKFSILEIIQEYYDANAREKARNLVKEVANLSEEKLNYYFSLDQKFEKTVSRDKQIALSIIQRLSQLTAQHGHNKLSKELKQTLNNSLSQMRQ
jgi:tetratricopeptide (TPR) repeat protein